MRIRLARKILKNHDRYSSQRVRRALVRLGWRLFKWKFEMKEPLNIEDYSKFTEGIRDVQVEFTEERIRGILQEMERKILREWKNINPGFRPFLFVKDEDSRLPNATTLPKSDWIGEWPG